MGMTRKEIDAQEHPLFKCALSRLFALDTRSSSNVFNLGLACKKLQ